MATRMIVAEFDILSERTPDAQRVAVMEEPGKITLKWALRPEAGPGEVRVRTHYVGICGSDIEAFLGHRSPEFLSTPARLGHEVAGVIDQVGHGVVGLKVGDRVSCRYVWGAFAEHIVCKPFNVLRAPDCLPMEEISLTEILPGVIHAAELSQIDGTKSVLITGQGVSGLVLTQVVKLYSPKALAVTDLHSKNLDLAKRYGATHVYQIADPEGRAIGSIGSDFPEGFDVVIPCLLSGDGVADAIDCAALGGRIVLYGCIGPCRVPLDFFKFHRKRLSLHSTEPRSDAAMRRWFDEGMSWVEQGLVNTAEMVTHILPLEEIQHAFDLRSDPLNDAIHILVDCR